MMPVKMKRSKGLNYLIFAIPLAFLLSCDEKVVEPDDAILSVSTTELDFGTDQVQLSFAIMNTGSGTLAWNIAESLNWASIVNLTGTTTIEFDTIVVIVDRPGLSPDILSGSILITSNGGSASVDIIAIDTIVASPGVFTRLILDRNLSINGHMGLRRNDLITARFDSSYSPCLSDIPLRMDSVSCNEYTLEWDDSLNSYGYDQTMPQSFLDLGLNYIFDISGNSFAPSLVDSIVFPLYEPYLTSPANEDTVSITADLNIAWENFGNGNVYISLVAAIDSACALPGNPGNIEGIFVETENNGYYSIPYSSLSNLIPGEYCLILDYYSIHFINADGYDPRSFILGKTTNRINLIIE